MADPAAIRQALTRIGFVQATAVVITDQGGQGLSTYNDFAYMDDDAVENFCRSLRRPGGTIGDPPQQNPGSHVSAKAEMNLKLMCYYIRHRRNVSRTLAWPDIDIDAIHSLREFRDSEEKHSDPDAPTITGNDWPKNIDMIEAYLRGCRGSTGLPLAYVVRDNEDIPDGDDPADNYSSIIDELIARAPILDGNGNYTTVFKNDRALVWDLLSAIGHDKDWWTYLRVAQRTRDGRLGFQKVKGHYLGVNNVDNMAAAAESKLTSLTYKGEGRRFNFEKYVRLHVEQHTILQGLTVHGYAGIDPRSKVRYLLSGIQTRDLDVTKNQILASEELRKDFDKSVNLIKDYLKQCLSSKGQDERYISGVGTAAKPAADEDADMSVEDRYYTYNEYQKLSHAKKLGLKMKRKARGDGKSPKKKSSANKRNIKAMEARLEKRFISAIADITKDDNDDGSASSADGGDADEAKAEQAKTTSLRNRIHKALKRKNHSK